MREDFYCTDLCLAQISDELATLGTPVCPSTVKDLLDEFDFSKRKIAKTWPGGEVPDRNTQFEHITRWRKRYPSRGNPVFSIDTKKKEHLGHLDLMRKTATKTGLTTTVRVIKKVYETGRKATQDFRDTISFRWDKVLPNWNYTAIPQ
jgi:hypothetical protein